MLFAAIFVLLHSSSDVADVVVVVAVVFVVVGRQQWHSTMMNVRRFYHLQFVANQRVTNYNSLAIFIIK